MNINTKIAKAMIDSIDNGQFFGITFIKSDGSGREMNARKGVKKHLKGGVSKYNGKDGEAQNIGVYDVKTGGYRCFKLDRLTELRIGGKVYKIS
jgi:hypothetical protein